MKTSFIVILLIFLVFLLIALAAKINGAKGGGASPHSKKRIAFNPIRNERHYSISSGEILFDRQHKT